MSIFAYAWYLHGFTQAALPQPSCVSTPPVPPQGDVVENRVAFALGVRDGLEARDAGPRSKVDVEKALSEAFPLPADAGPKEQQP